jgi:hypothetical protein
MQERVEVESRHQDLGSNLIHSIDEIWKKGEGLVHNRKEGAQTSNV